MFTVRNSVLTALVLISIFISGCGIGVPAVKEIWDTDYPGENSNPDDPTPPISASSQIEFEIKKQVFCELQSAARAASVYKYKKTKRSGELIREEPFLPLDWGAQISLSLEVEEHTRVTPSLTFNNPLPNAITNRAGSSSVTTSQIRMLGFGGELSSTATRTDKINAYYSIAYLLSHQSDKLMCSKGQSEDPFEKLKFHPARSSPFLIESQLGLADWLVGSLFASKIIPSYGAPTDKGALQNGPAKTPDTISVDIKFVIVSSASVTPTWKLVRVSADTSGSLFDTGRKRTHELIITIGPNNTRTDNSFLALQIKQALGSNNRLNP